MNEMDLGYIAGFVDGEGCITITKSPAKNSRKSPQYSIVMAIANTKVQALEWIRVTTGLRGCLARTDKGSEKWAIGYQLHYCPKDTLALLSMIYPALKLKKPQADIVMKFAAMRKANPKIGTGNGTLPLEPAFIEAEERYYQEIRALNKRGQ